MKEQLYTIPLNDAFDAQDECPFCFIEREIEHHLLDYVLGSSASYMEPDTREATDKAGFCQEHLHKMFHYGNTLGNAWILKTHYEQMLREMEQQFAKHTPSRPSLKSKFMRGSKSNITDNTIVQWLQDKKDSCYICNRKEELFQRYMNTFFYLYRKEPEFRIKFEQSKGFCLHHLQDLLIAADQQLKPADLVTFYSTIEFLMTTNFSRVHEDISWMISKFDYQNKDADWKNSKDAIQRGMQKLKSGYPSDPYFQGK